jgi:hypothetical protein
MGPSAPAPVLALTLVLTALGLGCSSVRSSAVRTGPERLPPRTGAVAIYASTLPPASAVELGIVEVHGSNTDGNIDSLLPLFVRRVAELGGNAAVIDLVDASFEVVPHAYPSAYFGMHMTFARPNPATDEVMVVSIRGRAFSVPPTSAGGGAAR